MAGSTQLVQIPLITTGGTIACKKGNGKDVVDRDFNRLVGEDLAKQGIKISQTHKAYNILSENINFDYVEKLVDELLRVIDAENPKRIVITHGTDSLDKVINLLVDLKFNLGKMHPGISETLVSKTKKLWEEIEEKDIALIFTAANDADEEKDIKPNIKGAFEYAARDDLEPGIHISFYESQFLVYGAHYRDADYLRPDVYDAKKGMRFVYGSNSDYQKRFYEHLSYMNRLIRELSDRLEQPFNERKLREDTDRVKIYDVTELRVNHNDFKSKITNDTKAVFLIMNHGSTANAPDPSQEEYREELSVAQLVSDLKKQYPKLKFFAATENYEPLDLDNYASSMRIRDAGVTSMGETPLELAIAKLKMLVEKGYETDKLVEQMTSD